MGEVTPEMRAVIAASAINPLIKSFHEEALADLDDAIRDHIRAAVLAEREALEDDAIRVADAIDLSDLDPDAYSGVYRFVEEWKAAIRARGDG